MRARLKIYQQLQHTGAIHHNSGSAFDLRPIKTYGCAATCALSFLFSTSYRLFSR
jgi:hypothetical protein